MRVRCFCLGICEGSCINRTWEVGGPRLSLQKNSKIPRPTPSPLIKNVPSLNGENPLKTASVLQNVLRGTCPQTRSPSPPDPMVE